MYAYSDMSLGVIFLLFFFSRIIVVGFPLRHVTYLVSFRFLAILDVWAASTWSRPEYNFRKYLVTSLFLLLLYQYIMYAGHCYRSQGL